MPSIQLFFSFCLLCGVSFAASPLSPETVRRQASDLLFYLGSGDTTLAQNDLDHLLAKEGEAVGMLYKRVYENRKKTKQTQEYLTKQKELERKGYYLFKNWELRQAVIELLFELGDGALEVLLDSIHSSRQEIVLGVIKALDRFQDNRIVLLMSDVLELDKWGRSKFSSLVRRQAVYALRKYMDQDLTRSLLMRAIKDRDPMLRQFSQEVVGQADAAYSDYINSTFLEGYDYELKLLSESSELAKARGAGELFNEDVYSLSSMSLLIENMARFTPSSFTKIHVPEEILSHRGLVRAFLVHHKSLPKELRQKVLDAVINLPADNLVLLDALKAMDKTDGDRYKSKIKPYLDLKNSPAVVYQALQLCGVWGLDPFKDELEMIAENSRQENIRLLAKQFLETL